MVLLTAVLIIEGVMLAQVFAGMTWKDFLAAIFPASIIAFTNEERASYSLTTLTPNATLEKAAQRKAEDMAAKGYFAHVSPNGKEPWDWLKEERYDYQFAGENLAVNFFDSSAVVHAWMDSPSHKANIVKPVYAEIGIGVAQGTYEGRQTTFVVQFFGTPRASAVAVTPPPQVPPTQVASTQTAPAASPAQVPLVESQEAPLAQARAADVQGESVAAPQGTSLIARIAGSPRMMAAWLLSGIAALLIVSLLLTFFIKIQVQPVDLLGTGTLAAAFIIGLIFLNSFILSGGVRLDDEAASSAFEALSSIETSATTSAQF